MSTAAFAGSVSRGLLEAALWSTDRGGKEREGKRKALQVSWGLSKSFQLKY